jgi:glutathione synthase/RimK-type ligase-like ATP-grasp enzyme
MSRIAFVTYRDRPTITSDDQFVATELHQQGVVVIGAAWDDPAVDWKSFDLLVIRSTWNYHLQPEAFAQWLGHRENEGCHILNPPAVVRWNMHKSYLSDLQKKGVAVPETIWLSRHHHHTPESLSTLLQASGWARIVVKPAVSATAFKTLLINAPFSSSTLTDICALAQERDLLLQEFLPEIQSDGEWSIIFFNKEFSHAVRKQPRAGDFRVQNDFGGSAQSQIPPPPIIQQSASILQEITEPLLYARVDGVVRNGKFILMELELIEPALFFSQQPERARLLAIEIMRHL